MALALGTAVVLRYVYWRTTSTLPPRLAARKNFIPGLLLYLAEMYSVFMLGLSLFIIAKPLPSRAPKHRRGGGPSACRRVHSDYNEDAALLADTIAAAKSMDYPADRLVVWLLDDGGSARSEMPTNVIRSAGCTGALCGAAAALRGP